jgi:hypothetical protein
MIQWWVWCAHQFFCAQVTRQVELLVVVQHQTRFCTVLVGAVVEV